MPVHRNAKAPPSAFLQNGLVGERLIASNVEIFSPGNTSTCAHEPASSRETSSALQRLEHHRNEQQVFGRLASCSR